MPPVLCFAVDSIRFVYYRIGSRFGYAVEFGFLWAVGILATAPLRFGLVKGSLCLPLGVRNGLGVAVSPMIVVV